MLKLFVFVTLALGVRMASAQVCAGCAVDHHLGGGGDALSALINLWGRVVNLTPDELNEHDLSTASVHVGGETIYLNSAFRDITRDWIRVYYRSLREDCGDCVDGDETRFMAEASDTVARSFVSRTFGDKIVHAIEHMVLGTAYVGARWGRVALTMKGGAEAGESILSLMTPASGVHLFCSVIDVAVFFGSSRVQTFNRLLTWAPGLEQTRVGAMIRAGTIAGAIRRARNRVRLVAEPVEVDEDALKELDLEGPNRWWGRAEGGKREAWLKKLLAKGDKGLVLRRREFLGSRMKRYLFMKSRKRGHSQYLAGDSTMDSRLRREQLWILQAQESIVQRGLKGQGPDYQASVRQSLQEASAQPDDNVRRGLAEEFASETYGDISRAGDLEKLMKDVELLFNPQVSRRARSYHVEAFQGLLNGFMSSILREVLDQRGDLYQVGKETLLGKVKAIGPAWMLHYNVLGVTAYIDAWVDFLKFVAMEKNPEILLKRKYEAMESFLRILEYMKSTEALLQARTPDDLDKYKKQNKKDMRRLLTFTPWLEKKMGGSILPWSEGIPECSEMDAVVQ